MICRNQEAKTPRNNKMEIQETRKFGNRKPINQETRNQETNNQEIKEPFLFSSKGIPSTPLTL